MKLLLVEDSPVAQAAFETAVRRIHELNTPQVEVVGSLAEAESRVRSCDVLVLDLTLPDAEPEQMLDFAREWVGYKPVLIISGTENDSHIVAAGAMGAGFLTKACVNCQIADGLRVELLRAQGGLRARQAKQQILHDAIRLLGAPA